MPNLIITDNAAKEAGEHINNIIKEHVGDLVCLLAGGSALDIVEYIHPGKKCFHAECKANSINGETLCNKTECRTIFMTGDEWVSGEHEINTYLQIKTRYPDHPLLQKIIETIPELSENENKFSERIEKPF